MGSDTFVFDKPRGATSFKAFMPAGGVGHDVIKIASSMVVDFAHLSVTASASDAVIHLGTPDDTITLKGIAPAALTHDNFWFSDRRSRRASPCDAAMSGPAGWAGKRASPISFPYLNARNGGRPGKSISPGYTGAIRQICNSVRNEPAERSGWRRHAWDVLATPRRIRSGADILNSCHLVRGERA